MSFVGEQPGRPAVLIALAQRQGEGLNEQELAAGTSILFQNLTGQPIEMAIALKHIMELRDEGYIEQDESGVKWRMTPLGTVVSRQWAPVPTEPEGEEKLSEDEIRAWRDRTLTVMQDDAKLAASAGFPQEQWLMMQSQRLNELLVLNRVLGERVLPDWLERITRPESRPPSAS